VAVCVQLQLGAVVSFLGDLALALQGRHPFGLIASGSSSGETPMATAEDGTKTPGLRG
jgi:hypothetical protein